MELPALLACGSVEDAGRCRTAASSVSGKHGKRDTG